MNKYVGPYILQAKKVNFAITFYIIHPLVKNMIRESNSEIQVETSTHQIENDYIYIVQINSFKRQPGVIEFKTHPEYFVSWEEASRFVRTLPIETDKDTEVRYYIQELSKSVVPLKLVISNVN